MNILLKAAKPSLKKRKKKIREIPQRLKTKKHLKSAELHVKRYCSCPRVGFMTARRGKTGAEVLTATQG